MYTHTYIYIYLYVKKIVCVVYINKPTMPHIPWLHDRLQSVVTVHAHTLGRTGTGFVVSADGYLLTAAHCVVDDAAVPGGGEHDHESEITVAFHSGATSVAVLVGFDMHADVAVLCLSSGPLPLSMPVRRHTYPRPGDTCVVVGNIFGQDPRSIAVGAVRNGRWKDPHGLSLLSTVLTDVATGAGTSGGPILDTAGYVVALHTAAYGSTPPVDPVSGQAYRSLDEAQQPMGSTQLGGGLASPMLWRIYEEIRANPARGLTKHTLPCTVIPCVPGNVGRIRRALGGGAGWSLPATGGYCVTAHTARGLVAGDVVVAVGGTRVTASDPASLHDATWLQDGTLSVEVLRGGTIVCVPGVQLVPLPAALDVAVGYTQFAFTRHRQAVTIGVTTYKYVSVKGEVTASDDGFCKTYTTSRELKLTFFTKKRGGTSIEKFVPPTKVNLFKTERASYSNTRVHTHIHTYDAYTKALEYRETNNNDRFNPYVYHANHLVFRKIIRSTEWTFRIPREWKLSWRQYRSDWRPMCTDELLVYLKQVDTEDKTIYKFTIPTGFQFTTAADVVRKHKKYASWTFSDKIDKWDVSGTSTPAVVIAYLLYMHPRFGEAAQCLLSAECNLTIRDAGLTVYTKNIATYGVFKQTGDTWEKIE